MQPVNFVICKATMKHPDEWTIFELRFYKTFKYYSFLFSNESNLDILAKTLNFLLALEQIFETCLSNFNSLSIVTPNSLTSELSQILSFPIFAHICSCL